MFTGFRDGKLSRKQFITRMRELGFSVSVWSYQDWQYRGWLKIPYQTKGGRKYWKYPQEMKASINELIANGISVKNLRNGDRRKNQFRKLENKIEEGVFSFG